MQPSYAPHTTVNYSSTHRDLHYCEEEEEEAEEEEEEEEKKKKKKGVELWPNGKALRW